MKKIWLIVSGALVALVLILFLARNVIARKSVEIGVERATSFPLTIGSVDLGIFQSRINVHDLKLMNPHPDFEEPLFVDLPTFQIDYRLGSMLSGKPHVNEMIIDLNQLVIVKNAKGESNVARLKGVASSGSSTNTTKYRVDLLKVHIGSVVVKDYSSGKLTEHKKPLDYSFTYRDITDSTDISRLVILTVMTHVHLPDLNVNAADLKKGLTGAQTLATGAVKDATTTVEKTGKDVLDMFKKK